MNIKVLHLVGGSLSNGAAKGASILHEELLNIGVNSKLLTDDSSIDKISSKFFFKKNVILIQQSLFDKILNLFFVNIQKIIKSLFLHSPRETFTLSLFGFDITKRKEYKEADLLHIHWLSEGFINLKSLSKVNKPIIWTMRDEWAYTGGAHYKSDFKKYEKGHISKLLKNYKKKIYNKNFQFVALSNWLKTKAEKSDIINKSQIIKIDNNIQLKDFILIDKDGAKSILGLTTEKQIILYGAQNPQSERKGWKIFLETLKVLDKSKFFLLIFGKFWSHELLDKIGVNYKSLGFVTNQHILNALYSSGDIFVASSLQDAWPKTFAEAMYCATPAVCFDQTSISEIVEHKKNGFIVKKREAKALKEGIIWLLDETKKNNLIGLQAREKIKNYDPKIIAKKYLNLYKKKLLK